MLSENHSAPVPHHWYGTRVGGLGQYYPIILPANTHLQIPRASSFMEILVVVAYFCQYCLKYRFMDASKDLYYISWGKGIIGTSTNFAFAQGTKGGNIISRLFESPCKQVFYLQHWSFYRREAMLSTYEAIKIVALPTYLQNTLRSARMCKSPNVDVK